MSPVWVVPQAVPAASVRRLPSAPERRNAPRRVAVPTVPAPDVLACRTERVPA